MIVTPAYAGVQGGLGMTDNLCLDSGFPPKGTSFGARRNDGIDDSGLNSA